MENTEFKIDSTNVEQQKAFDLVENTNTSLFITGKAGTGKTTFIKGIQKLIKKNFLVLAPTGIAAMNVKGLTLHSFFGLPFTAMGLKDWPKVNDDHRDLLTRVDSIIIDEASMVRCDWALSQVNDINPMHPSVRVAGERSRTTSKFCPRLKSIRSYSCF